MDLLTLLLGVAFACMGWNKLFNSGRHAVFTATLADDLPKVGLGFALRPLAWILPATELGAGTLAALAALAGAEVAILLALVPIFGISLVALYCEGAARVRGYHPINRGDSVADWLYMPESWYAAVAGAALLDIGARL